MPDLAASRVRRGRPNARFTAISNALIDHPDLSPEARIVLIYLLARPENWQLRFDDVRRVLGTGARRAGRNKAYEVIRELKQSAYVVAVEVLDEGRYCGIDYYVFDEPHPDPDGFKAELRCAARRSSGQDEQERSTRSHPPFPGKRDTANSPSPGSRDPAKRDSTKEREEQKTEPSPPSPTPDRLQSTAWGGEGSSEFLSLWESWPAAARPNNRRHTEKRYLALTPVERVQAVKFAANYLRAAVYRAEFPALIVYLRDQLFAEFEGAPEFTHDGYFKVTPSREEWAAWIASYESQFTARAVASIHKTGFLLTRTRWPERASNEKSVPALERGCQVSEACEPQGRAPRPAAPIHPRDVISPAGMGA